MTLTTIIPNALAHVSLPQTTLAQSQDFMSSVWLTEPSSTFARQHDPLFMFIFWVCTVLFVGLMGVMFYFCAKYVRRPGKAQERSMSHNTALELTWTILPLFLLAVIFVWGFRGYVYMQVAPVDAEQMNLSAIQWNWEMVYDNGGISTMTTVVADKDVPIFPVPANRPTRMQMISRDVLHSFFVPDFRVKLDIFPNRYTSVWFTPTSVPEPVLNDAGEVIGTWKDHYLFCTEYCGDGHSQMGAIIRVMPEADYIAWKQAASNPYEDLSPTEIGELAWTIKGCNACHSVEPNGAGTGPTWYGIWGDSHQFTDGTSAVVDENYIRSSILVPGEKIVSGYTNQMPSYQGQLSEEELAGFIAYIQSLAD